MRLPHPSSSRIPLAAVALLAAAFVLPGLIGHDPWKQDETYIFSIIDHMLRSGDWIVPQSAGIPFVEKPPLYYWTGAAFAHALSPWLAIFDGARLATGLYMALTLLFAGLAARTWWGADHGRLAVLALMPCLGLVYESHLMTTNLPHMAGFAIACHGFAVAQRRPLAAGIWIGLGAGISFLGKGLLAPAVLGITALVLPALFRRWRSLDYARTLGTAALVSLPWLVGWPLALYERSPELFREWFWMNNVGRFVGFSVAQLGASNDSTFWIRTLPWFAFPALPLAGLTVWRERARIDHCEALQFGVVCVSVYLAVLLTSASARGGYALPLLVPLALLAAPSVASLPSWIDRRIDIAGRVLFTAAVAALWSMWAVMELHGHAPAFAWLGRVLPLQFAMPYHPVAAAVAVMATVVWRLSWRPLSNLPERGVAGLAAGITVGWLLTATLWLPWIDYAKSYRSVLEPLRQHLPPGTATVGGIGLDESVGAMLLYFCGVTPIAVDDAAAGNVAALLVQNDGVEGRPLVIPPGWRMVWEGSRPGDRHERLRLYLPPQATLVESGRASTRPH